MAVVILSWGAGCAPLFCATESTLHLRLLTPLSTRTSASGDAVAAAVTRPMRVGEHDALVPVGAVVKGRVLEARGVGLGLKRERARLSFRFDDLVLPGGERLSLDAAFAGFDNARETVDKSGRVRGIRSTNALSDRMNVRLGGLRFTPFRMAFRSAMATFPLQSMAVWFANGMIFGLTDPEIHYPAGSDFELRLLSEWQHEARFPVYRGERPSSGPPPAVLEDFLDQQPALSYFEKGRAEADPVNLVLMGEPDRAFIAAGWHGADAQGRRNCFRALRAVATESPYAHGPMTPLVLNGERPAAEWQKGLNTYARRHHLRVWPAPGALAGEPAWLVAATHDIGLTVEARRLTHRVDRRLDLERERVVYDLLLTGCVDSVTYVERPRVATRSWITDGRVAVVRLNACANPTVAPASGPLPTRSLPWRLLQRLTLNARNTLLRENNFYRGYDFIRNVRQWKRQRGDGE